jgi:hypothetical protein
LNGDNLDEFALLIVDDVTFLQWQSSQALVSMGHDSPRGQWQPMLMRMTALPVAGHRYKQGINMRHVVEHNVMYIMDNKLLLRGH